MNPQVIEKIFTDWLNQQLAGTSLAAILQPLKKDIEKNPQKGEGGLFEKVSKDFTRNLITVIAPLTTLATLLTQSTSGLSLFLGTINILAMTIAPVLIPFFIILGAVVLLLASKIEENLFPVLDKFYEWLAVNAVEAISTFIEWIKKTKNALIEWVDKLTTKEGIEKESERVEGNWDKFIQSLVDADNKLGRLVKNITGRETTDEKMKRMGEEGVPFDEMQKIFGAGDFKDGAAGGGGDGWGGPDPAAERRKQAAKDRAEFIGGLKDLTKQFRMENMPQASLTGLVQASRSAQMAALNAQPLQQRQLKITEQIAGKLDRLVAAAEKRNQELMGD